MTQLPSRPNLDHLRHQAKDRLRSDPNRFDSLAAAQLATARDYGFASWPKLKLEVERRAILDGRDPAQLRALIIAQPELAVQDMTNWRDHGTIAPLQYVALMRCVVAEDIWRDMPGSGVIAQMLIDAGALVDGGPDVRETPLITAASYGDLEVARVLVEAGASLDVLSAPDAGGVPNATALMHAAVFGFCEIVDLLAAAGAKVEGITQFAAVGDLSGWDLAAVPQTDRVLALIMAADHQRLAVIDALLDAGTPIDAEDAEWGRQALRVAAANGRVDSVRHLLARGADPNHRDPARNRTALYWSRRHKQADRSRHEAVQQILAPITARAR